MDDVVNRLEKNLTLNKVSLALEALESLDNVMPILERMPNLINLDLHGNKLSKLPRDLSKLKKFHVFGYFPKGYQKSKFTFLTLFSNPYRNSPEGMLYYIKNLAFECFFCYFLAKKCSSGGGR